MTRMNLTDETTILVWYGQSNGAIQAELSAELLHDPPHAFAVNVDGVGQVTLSSGFGVHPDFLVEFHPPFVAAEHVLGH